MGNFIIIACELLLIFLGFVLIAVLAMTFVEDAETFKVIDERIAKKIRGKQDED